VPSAGIQRRVVLSLWFLAQLIFSALKMDAICASETSVDTTNYTALRTGSSIRNIHKCFITIRALMF
jgi:hypothetical protein